MLVPRERLERFTAACLEKLGVQPADAQLVAQTLVAANLRGVDSHGVVRLPHYATRLRNGSVQPRPNITVERTAPSAALIEGDAERIRTVNRQIAALPGPLVLVQAASREELARNPDAYCLNWLLEEVSTSINTAAAGGNASLMSIG